MIINFTSCQTLDCFKNNFVLRGDCFKKNEHLNLTKKHEL